MSELQNLALKFNQLDFWGVVALGMLALYAILGVAALWVIFRNRHDPDLPVELRRWWWVFIGGAIGIVYSAGRATREFPLLQAETISFLLACFLPFIAAVPLSYWWFSKTPEQRRGTLKRKVKV